MFNKSRHDAVELVKQCEKSVEIELLRFPSITEVLATKGDLNETFLLFKNSSSKSNFFNKYIKKVTINKYGVQKSIFLNKNFIYQYHSIRQKKFTHIL